LSKKKIYRRGKVTRENSIFSKNGSVLCPLSSNKYTDDEYFIIDADLFHLVEGRSWSVLNDASHKGMTHYNIRAWVDGGVKCLHWVLFQKQTLAKGLTTDHLYHWLDNRRASVEFVSFGKNASRGPAMYHRNPRR